MGKPTVARPLHHPTVRAGEIGEPKRRFYIVPRVNPVPPPVTPREEPAPLPAPEREPERVPA